MLRNNKGFVFIETLIVISVLAISLILIYRGFSSAITLEKRRMNFDNPVYLYRTYYIRNFLYETGISRLTDYLKTAQAEDGSRYLLYSFICDDNLFNQDYEEICYQLVMPTSSLETSYLDVSNVYILNHGFKEVFSKTNNNANDQLILRSLPMEGIDYLRSMANQYSENNFYIMIEYKDNCIKIENEDINQTEELYSCDYYYASMELLKEETKVTG